MREVVFDTAYEDYIGENFRYDAETGLVWWTKKGSNSRKVDKPCGCKMSTGHLTVGICPAGFKRTSVLVHRLAWRLFYEDWPLGDLDHINGVRTDNRINNLRIADASENAANTKLYKSNTVGYKGVHKLPCGRYKARVQFRGRRVSLGIFNTPEEAYNAYVKGAVKMQGEFARV